MSQANLDYNSSTNLQALPLFLRSQLPKSQINQWKKLLSAKRAELFFLYASHPHFCAVHEHQFFFIDFFLTCMMDFAKKKGLLVVLSSAYQNNYDNFY